MINSPWIALTILLIPLFITILIGYTLRPNPKSYNKILEIPTSNCIPNDIHPIHSQMQKYIFPTISINQMNQGIVIYRNKENVLCLRTFTESKGMTSPAQPFKKAKKIEAQVGPQLLWLAINVEYENRRTCHILNRKNISETFNTLETLENQQLLQWINTETMEQPHKIIQKDQDLIITNENNEILFKKEHIYPGVPIIYENTVKFSNTTLKLLLGENKQWNVVST